MKSINVFGLFFTAIAAAPVSEHATSRRSTVPFTQIIAFGDEFSDNGNGSFAHGKTGYPANIYGYNTWTNGPIAVSYLSDKLSLGPQGLWSYAFGGANGGEDFGATLDNSYTESSAGAASLVDQVGNYTGPSLYKRSRFHKTSGYHTSWGYRPNRPRPSDPVSTPPTQNDTTPTSSMIPSSSPTPESSPVASSWATPSSTPSSAPSSGISIQSPSNCLGFMWVGQNDMSEHTVPGSLDDPANSEFASDFSTKVAASVQTLLDSGIPYVLVANIYPKHLAPVAAESVCGSDADCATTWGQVISNANAALKTSLQQFGSKVIYYDVFSYITNLSRAAEANGFTKPLTDYCDGQSEANWQDCMEAGNAGKYFWMSSTQPTTRVHNMIAEDMRVTIWKQFGSG